MDKEGLRKKAEELLKKRGKIDEELYKNDIETLVEELSIYQIELEQQNEELRKTQNELRKEKEQYSDLFRSAPVGYVLLSEDDTILTVNQTASDLLQLPESALVGNFFRKYIHPDFQDKFYFHLKNVSKYKKDSVDLRIKRAGSDCFFARAISRPDNSTGKQAVRMGIININREKELAQKLLEEKENALEANRMVSNFVANISHEIRTPMNAITGFAALLARKNLSDEKRDKYLNIVNDSSRQLLNIINDVLELSQLETRRARADYQVVCLNALVEEFYENYYKKAEKKQLEFNRTSELPLEKCKIICDEEKLKSIYTNLLENAFKFTTQGSIEFGYNVDGMRLNLFVKDTGIGISEEMQEKVFTRFTQEESGLCREYGGLGLGLSIVKENAELLDGSVKLKSEKGVGTEVFVNLPFNSANEEPEKSKKKNETKPEAVKILVAEDEEINYMFIETLLDEIVPEAEIYHAANGREAVEFCNQYSGFSLVLMDIKMPLMDGYEATKQIKKICPEVNIVAQTAYAAKSDINKAKRAGCIDHLAKPISEESFKEIVLKYIR